MKLKLKAEELLSAIKTTSDLLKEKKANPILTFYLFEIEGNNLTVTTSHDDGATISVSAEIDNETKESAKILVPQKIKDILLLVDGTIEVTYDNISEKMEITSQYGVTNITCGNNVNLYPSVNFDTETENYTAMTIPGDVLKKGIAYCAPFVSGSPIRPVLGSVHIEIENGIMTLVGTDSISCAFYEKEVAGCPDFTGNLPSAYVTTLSNIINDGDIKFQSNGSAVRFTSNKVSFAFPLTIGQYVHFRRILPKHEDIVSSTTLKKADISHSIAMVGTCTSKSTKLVKLVVSGETLTITGEDIDTGSNASAFSGCISAEFRIGMNINNLANAIRVIPSDDIEIRFIAENRPLILSAQGETDSFIMLMPVNA